jgi:hypothetical protein
MASVRNFAFFEQNSGATLRPRRGGRFDVPTICGNTKCFPGGSVGAGIQLAAESTASASASPPGQISVTPATVVPGSTANPLTFVYAPGDKRLSDGTASVKIPKGWTPPRRKVPETPGDVEVSSGKLAVSNRVVTVSDLTLCKTCWLTLIYSDVTAPATPGSASFLTKAARTGEPLEPLTPEPTVVIGSSSLCNPTFTTSSGGPPTLTADPGTCLSGGTPISVTGLGYDASSLGILLQCNNAPDQPTVSRPAPISETVPVSCTGIALAMQSPRRAPAGSARRGAQSTESLVLAASPAILLPPALWIAVEGTRRPMRPITRVHRQPRSWRRVTRAPCLSGIRKGRLPRCRSRSFRLPLCSPAPADEIRVRTRTTLPFKMPQSFSRQ